MRHRHHRRPQRRGLLRTIAATGLVAANLAFAAFVLLGFRGAPPAPFVPSATLQIATLAEVGAGEPFEVWVAGAGERTVTLSLDAGYGPRRLEAISADDLAYFEVGAADRPESGTVLLTAQSGELVGNSSMEIAPGPAADPLDLYLGPRTVPADTEHFTMLVAVPKDRYGNPVSNGTQVSYETTRPNRAKEFESRSTDRLLSHYIVFSRTVTGRTRIATTVDGAGGPERSFLEVAGVPDTFGLAVPDEIPSADGQALVPVITDELFDVYGNQLPDGTAVVLDATGVTGIRRLNGVTIDGRAEFHLEVPDRAGSVQLVATASGTRSTPLEVGFEPAVIDITATAEPDAEGTRVVVGPIRTVRDSYVPDGTEVVIEYDESIVSGVFYEGVASVVVPRSVDRYRVLVLGAEAPFTVQP